MDSISAYRGGYVAEVCFSVGHILLITFSIDVKVESLGPFFTFKINCKLYRYMNLEHLQNVKEHFSLWHFVLITFIKDVKSWFSRLVFHLQNKSLNSTLIHVVVEPGAPKWMPCYLASKAFHNRFQLLRRPGALLNTLAYFCYLSFFSNQPLAVLKVSACFFTFILLIYLKVGKSIDYSFKSQWWSDTIRKQSNKRLDQIL